MDEPNKEELEGAKRDDKQEDTKPLAPQKKQKYPNNLTPLCEKKGLRPYHIISKMNKMLDENLVVENYRGWEEGEHLPNRERRAALVEIFEVEDEKDIWPTISQILKEREEGKRAAALQKYANKSQTPPPAAPPAHSLKIEEIDEKKEPVQEEKEPSSSIETELPHKSKLQEALDQALENKTEIELADDIGVELRTLQRWREGTRQPQQKIRPKLRDILGKSFKELGLDNKGDETNLEEDIVEPELPSQPASVPSLVVVSQPQPQTSYRRFLSLLMKPGISRRQFLTGVGKSIAFGVPTTALAIAIGYGIVSAITHPGSIFERTPPNNIPKTPTQTPTPTPQPSPSPEPSPRPLSIGSWLPVGNMARPRVFHSATMLSRNMVLVAGGKSAPDVLIDIAELFNSDTNQWRTTKNLLLVPRVTAGNALVTLQTGEALFVTGTDASGGEAYSQVEVFSSTQETWRQIIGLGTPRRSATVVPLNGRQVLVTGGAQGLPDEHQFIDRTELFDLQTYSWRTVGKLTVARQNALGLLLRNGGVMIAGGEGPWKTYGTTVEIFDPHTGQWATAAPAPWGFIGATMTLISQNRVLVVGGSPDSITATSEVAIYHVDSNTWTSAQSMGTPRKEHTASLLPDGRVLIAGGNTGTHTLATCEVYNPITDQWEEGPLMHSPRRSHVAVPLLSGSHYDILVIGGLKGRIDEILDSCERLQITLK